MLRKYYISKKFFLGYEIHSHKTCKFISEPKDLHQIRVIIRPLFSVYFRSFLRPHRENSIISLCRNWSPGDYQVLLLTPYSKLTH